MRGGRVQNFATLASVNERLSRNLRNVGVAVVLGAYAIDVISRRSTAARLVADSARIRATRWLSEPGATLAVVGEVLVQAGKLSSGNPVSPPSLDEG